MAVYSGRQALDVAALDPPDLLLTDMRMPVMDGHELIRRIRESRPALPVIIITGYGEDLPRAEPGQLAILPKPIPFRTLMNAIRALLAAQDSS